MLLADTLELDCIAIKLAFNGKCLLLRFWLEWEALIKLLPAPFRTHIPNNTPKWFTDYVGCANQWMKDAHEEILTLHLKIKDLENQRNKRETESSKS